MTLSTSLSVRKPLCPARGALALRVEALGPVCLRDWDALFWASKRKVKSLKYEQSPELEKI